MVVFLVFCCGVVLKFVLVIFDLFSLRVVCMCFMVLVIWFIKLLCVNLMVMFIVFVYLYVFVFLWFFMISLFRFINGLLFIVFGLSCLCKELNVDLVSKVFSLVRSDCENEFLINVLINFVVFLVVFSVIFLVKLLVIIMLIVFVLILFFLINLI